MYKKRRSLAVVLILIFSFFFSFAPQPNSDSAESHQNPEVLSGSESMRAMDALEEIAIKGRAPKTGYSRSEFSSGWATVDGCDIRNIILGRSLENISYEDECIVSKGRFVDPYTGETIEFIRGQSTSSQVQIDHVVALSDAWQKGAQLLSVAERYNIANDPLNLLAVTGPANQQKGDSDAASWLPKNKLFRCRYIARQIAVKAKYKLWVTSAEKAAMKRVLNGCPEQVLPVEK